MLQLARSASALTVAPASSLDAGRELSHVKGYARPCENLARRLLERHAVKAFDSRVVDSRPGQKSLGTTLNPNELEEEPACLISDGRIVVR